MALERAATAQVVEDGKQEFKRDREDVRKMEEMLARTRERIAEVAEKLAVCVRERFEHSLGGVTRSEVEPLMANALDRVKATEAKYAAMVGTAEKLESTLKELKSTAHPRGPGVGRGD